jgi:hypothetical protein
LLLDLPALLELVPAALVELVPPQLLSPSLLPPPPLQPIRPRATHPIATTNVKFFMQGTSASDVPSLAP